MSTLDDLIDRLLAQETEVQRLREQLLREQVRKLIHQHGESKLLAIVEEECAQSFAKGEIATHRTERGLEQ